MNKICVIGSVGALSVSFLAGMLFTTYRTRKATDDVEGVKTMGVVDDEETNQQNE